MHRRITRAVLGAATAGATLTTLGLTAASAAGGATLAAQPVSTLTAIRAAHTPGHDRLVFQFRGPLPTLRAADYVAQALGFRPRHLPRWHRFRHPQAGCQAGGASEEK